MKMSRIKRTMSTMTLSKIVEVDSPGKLCNSVTEQLCSPVTQITHELNKSSLSSDSPRTVEKPKFDSNRKEKHVVNFSTNEGGELLFKNVFKIKNTPESIQSRRSRRSLGTASRRLAALETTPSIEIDKENDSAPCSPFSLMSSPQSISGKSKSRFPLEDCDPNSQDSGYGASYPDEMAKSHEGFQFAEPSGCAPRRMSIDSARGGSPQQSPIRSSPHRARRNVKSLLEKMSSGYESMDDGFNELIDSDNFMENTEVIPNGLTDLLSADLVNLNEKPMDCDAATTPEFSRTRPSIVRRSLSLKNHNETNSNSICSTPPMSKIRACLFRSPSANSSGGKLGFNNNSRSMYISPELSPLARIKSFKRPEPPTDQSPVLVKRSKRSCSMRDFIDKPIIENSNLFSRCYSETEAHANIKSAIHRSTTDADLTGDFSKTCILPLAEGQHEDLKSISVDTLRRLIAGEFNDKVATYKIVDCRYPYEYEAGHIDGALNLYTKDLIDENLMQPLNKVPEIQPDTDKRHVIVFHCEFSWERGPNLSRYLRNIDRKLNKEYYPALHYPEIYILHGGYMQFYRDAKYLCVPEGYLPMNHPDHDTELRKFRSKSKSQQSEKTSRGLPPKSNLKRLGF